MRWGSPEQDLEFEVCRLDSVLAKHSKLPLGVWFSGSKFGDIKLVCRVYWGHGEYGLILGESLERRGMGMGELSKANR